MQHIDILAYTETTYCIVIGLLQHEDTKQNTLHAVRDSTHYYRSYLGMLVVICNRKTSRSSKKWIWSVIQTGNRTERRAYETT